MRRPNEYVLKLKLKGTGAEAEYLLNERIGDARECALLTHPALIARSCRVLCALDERATCLTCLLGLGRALTATARALDPLWLQLLSVRVRSAQQICKTRAFSMLVEPHEYV